MLAGIEGFREYVAGSGSEQLAERGDAAMLLRSCETRLAAYIAPCEPRCAMQTEAFCRAVYAQAVYEEDGANAQLRGMPGGVRSFSVNGFSATLDSVESAVGRAGIAPEARAGLMLAGLLYRGVGTC